MAGLLKRPAFLFALIVILTLVFIGFGMQEWGYRYSERVALVRDDFGSSRKHRLLGKLHTSSPFPAADASGLVDQAQADLLQAPQTEMRVIAIRVSDYDLYDPDTGLQANSDKRGRNWERLGAVAISQNGRETLAAQAGIRLQGNGMGRDRLHSFRLYFRSSYGLKEVPANLFLDEATGVLRKVVVRKEKNTNPGFVNMLVFDIGRRLGCTTPDYAPGLFFVNGKNIGLSLISEHVNRKHWERKLGRRNFDFNMLEGDNTVIDKALYRGLRFRLDPVFQLWTEKYVRSLIDLDDFSNLFIAVVFPQWQDWNQGAFMRDHAEASPRWKNVLWDGDMAFAELRPNGVPAKRAGWKNIRDAHGLRASIFRGLWENSPSFREKFLARISLAINHQLTAAWLTDRVRHYAELEKQTQLECFDEKLARAYLLSRRRMLMDETVAELHAPPVVTCTVNSQVPVFIDSASESTQYEGIYFRGQRITLHCDAPGFSHWLVNGQTALSPHLPLTLNGNTSVQAVYQEPGNRS